MPPSDAEHIASLIIDGFDRHYRRFRALSSLAKGLFEQSDWRGMRAASRERMGSYDAHVSEAVQRILVEVPRAAGEAVWPAVKRALVLRLLDHQQPELAETFYNSVACRVLRRAYYTNEYLFWRQVVATENLDSLQPTFRAYYPAERGLAPLLRQVVLDLHLVAPWEDLERDLADLLSAVSPLLPRPEEVQPSLQVHILTSLFFRRHAAYLVGRVRNGPDERAFAVAIRKTPEGKLALDAFLTGRDELVQLFTLSRAYFLVDMEVPSAVVAFLRSVLPARYTAELYTSLGLQKQGKTLFYRELDAHLKQSTDRFDIAPGVKGMVMVVFTMPSFPWVFKLIRDHFEPPKDADRAQVMAQYTRVKLHDRVGRMADTWEYSDVALPLTRIAPALLEELEKKAPSALERVGDRLILKHVYIERRLVPLDLYLRQVDEERRRAAIIDYGEAIRELAATNIFPGDLLLKNFGVSRLHRVVFYDYDEIAPVTECVFRALPSARDDEDEYAREPWYSVGPHDIFPEELPAFLFADDRDRAVFLEVHGDLATPAWWVQTQERLLRGEEVDVKPYPESKTFRARRTQPPAPRTLP
jgi:isocitrate dehydrogenase kinase/phosphatase